MPALASALALLPACEADVTAHYAIGLASAAATYTVTATAKQGDTRPAPTPPAPR